MIQANELRIGNWITILKEGGGYKYQVASGHDIEEIDGCPESVNPILLTPEILEQCGFTKTHEGGPNDCEDWTHEKKAMKLHYDEETFWFGYWNMPKVNHNIGVVYLHQLQNLYFALTGQELEIKELVK